MPEYRFTFVIAGCDQLTSSVMDALCAAACTDCTPSMQAGQLNLDFCRYASNLGYAVGTAIRDVERAEVGRLMSVYLEGWQGLQKSTQSGRRQMASELDGGGSGRT